ncbi:MAG: SDR family NAD(P)-dependent oxidoreductase [Gemmatimonadetes bacterium]|nr:SDR family NAD(P)-dependent oxidoreductase [Gemmatimonadota bacterium]
MTLPSAQGPLAGQHALVTGASKGIGAATARALAAAGAVVAVSARSAAALEALVKELGAGHRAIVADLSTAAGADALIAAVRAWAGGAPAIIVNNAGAFPHAAIGAQEAAGLSQTLRLNLEAPFQIVNAFIGDMRARKSGDIVTVGSVADKTAFTGNAEYSASKYGVRAMHEVLRSETKGSGIRAILVSPGSVDTEIWMPYESLLGSRFPARESMLAADDVARAIAFALTQPRHVDIDELRLTRS